MQEVSCANLCELPDDTILAVLDYAGGMVIREEAERQRSMPFSGHPLRAGREIVSVATTWS